MRAWHSVQPILDDPNLVSAAGLVPLLRLAQCAGLHDHVAGRWTVDSPNAVAKVTGLVAAMLSGANSIEDLGVLRHGGVPRLFDGVRAPRRWARSCARPPTGTCSNSTRSAAG